MSNFKVINVKSGEEVVVDSLNAVSSFILAANVTKSSAKTVKTAVKKYSVGSDAILYNTFKIENGEGDVNMLNEKVEGQVEEVIAENTVEVEVPEVETVNPADLATNFGDDASDNPALHEDVPTAEEIAEAEYLESDAAAEQVEKENAEFEEIVTADQPKDEPKSEDKKSDEEPKENKRRMGKGIVAFKNGVEFATYPSIKAAATAFKELMGLPHMPFTPIMKSVRQDIDWNEYSFKHENEADLHIPESLKAKLSKQAEKPVADGKAEDAPATETAVAADEVIEEIVEEIIEEPTAEAK